MNPQKLENPQIIQMNAGKETNSPQILCEYPRHPRIAGNETPGLPTHHTHRHPIARRRAGALGSQAVETLRDYQ